MMPTRTLLWLALVATCVWTLACSDTNIASDASNDRDKDESENKDNESEDDDGDSVEESNSDSDDDSEDDDSEDESDESDEGDDDGEDNGEDNAQEDDGDDNAEADDEIADDDDTGADDDSQQDTEADDADTEQEPDKKDDDDSEQETEEEPAKEDTEADDTEEDDTEEEPTPSITSDFEFPEISGNTYYIDPVGGDDANSGLSETEAWKTLDNVGGGGFGGPGGGGGGGGTVQDGDGVLIKRGTTLEVSTFNPRGGIIYSTYGDGTRPTITSSAAVSSNVTMEGLKFQSADTTDRTGVMVSGSNNIVHDCEVDGSDGIFELGFGVHGEGNIIIGNSVHDLSGMTGDSGDMNTSGGAEAYMIMASNNEIAYNSAVNCWGPNETLGGAEGGCLEIVNGQAGATIDNVVFHHNYCERSVGLYEGCSGNFSGADKIQENHAIIKDAVVAYNLAVDAMWLYLLQPVNTDFVNNVFENNTIIHGPANEDIPQQGASSFGLVVSEDQGYSFDLKPGDIKVRNNIFAVVNGGASGMISLPPDGDHYNNMYIPSAPMGASTGDGDVVGDVSFNDDWSPVAGSLGINAGTTDTWQSWTDLNGILVPQGGTPDIGAFEFAE